jgi:glycosyltransferase involved in cell wall biosynthesis
VIGSTAAAGPETVTDGEAGLLVPPDSEETLISALRKLLADDDLCERLGRRGREIAVERYALEKVAARTVEFYRQCLRGNWRG